MQVKYQEQFLHLLFKLSGTLLTHIHYLKNNPHTVTATQVGLGTDSTPTFAGISIGAGSSTWTIDDTTANVLTFKDGINTRLEIKSGGLYVNGSTIPVGVGSGTVTSVGGTGTVSGITLTGTVATTGNLTLGGSISGLTTSNLSASAGIVNAQLANSSITVGTTAISLGSSSTTLAGLTSVTSTVFTTGTGTQTWQIAGSSSNLLFKAGSTPVTKATLFSDGALTLSGKLTATSKSFLIDHPTKEGYKLQHGSLEGPENGVYVRGRLKNNNVIQLPDYWRNLVDEDTITVSLTAIGRHRNLFVEHIETNKVYINNDTMDNQNIDCFYVVYGERKDIDKLEVEMEAN